jgi:hypothetical protein
MTKEEIDDKIDEWNSKRSLLSLPDYLGMSWMQYSLYVEYGLIPEQPIDLNVFLDLRAKKNLAVEEAEILRNKNHRFGCAIDSIKRLMNESLSNEGWIKADEIASVLERMFI